MDKEEIAPTTNPRNAIRCAKAAMLLLSLRPRLEAQEKEMMKGTVNELKMDLVKERYMRRNLKVVNLVEFVVQIVLLFGLATLFVLLAFRSG